MTRATSLRSERPSWTRAAGDVVPKRRRTQLAKAELILHLAMTVERWSRDLLGIDVRPLSEWEHDDPFMVLCRTYNLKPADLSKICHGLGDELEARAIRAGYEEHWDPA